MQQQATDAPPLTLEDRIAIQDLVARYNWAIDTQDGEGVADTFVADGVFDGPTYQYVGREGLVRLGIGRPHGPTYGAQHWTTNMVVEGNAERVASRSYFIRQSIEGGVITAGPLGYYRDVIDKVDGRWLFARRSIRTWPPTEETESNKA